MKKILYTILAIAVCMSTGLFNMSSVSAAGVITSLSDTMSRLQKEAESTHKIIFNVQTGLEEVGDKIVIEMPNFNPGFITPAGVTLRYGTDYNSVYTGTGCAGDATCYTATIAAAPDEDVWGYDGLTLTVPTSYSSALQLASGYVFIGMDDTYDIVNPNTSGNHIITITTKDSDDVVYDTGQLAVYIIDKDQVQVSGTVDPSISFAISDDTVGFGNMNVAAARYATGDGQGSGSAVTAFSVDSIATNAANGLNITIQSNNTAATAGLYSSTRGSTITAAVLDNIIAGTDGFGFCAINESNPLNIEGGFLCGTTSQTISISPQRFAYIDEPISNGYADIQLKAAVGGTTKAATDYATTLTVIATGNF